VYVCVCVCVFPLLILLELLRLLQSGTTLIVDRYSYSGVAFTAAKGLDFDWCCAPEKGLPEPDAVLFLDMTIEEAKLRGDYGAERYEREEFQLKVREMYKRLAGPTWTTINAARSMDAVHEDMKRAAMEIIKGVGDKPIKTLWSSN
jgi:dTMP kinase